MGLMLQKLYRPGLLYYGKLFYLQYLRIIISRMWVWQTENKNAKEATKPTLQWRRRSSGSDSIMIMMMTMMTSVLVLPAIVYDKRSAVAELCSDQESD